MSLKKFGEIFKYRDVQRQNRYRVAITGPMGADEQVNLLCESATFPGQNIRTATDDLRAGPVREIGHGVTYGPITLNFITTAGNPEKKFFELWQGYMFHPDTWQAYYYRDYIGEIKMYQLDRSDADRYEITIYEAYAKIVMGQDFAYNNNDSYQNVSVEFAFHHWVSKTTPAAVSPTPYINTKFAVEDPPSFSSPTSPEGALAAKPKPKTVFQGEGNFASPNATPTIPYVPTPAQPSIDGLQQKAKFMQQSKKGKPSAKPVGGSVGSGTDK